MTAALPAYLKDFCDAAPGHHFSLYYAGWNGDFSKPKSGVSDVLRNTVCKLPKHSRDLLAALSERQKSAAESLPDKIFTYPAIASAPFSTGLGNEHPLENGFSFLTPYGLPYLPGSGVKGVIRKAAEELLSGEWSKSGDEQQWSEENIRTLFGPGEEDATRDSSPQQGALRFWDVIPTPPASSKNDKALLTVEIMTPHMEKYYKGDDTPNTSQTPKALFFLALATETCFTFHVECNTALLNAELQDNWRTFLKAAFMHAGKWLGFGSKTAVGYGRMILDPVFSARQEQTKANEIAVKNKVAEKARIAALPPEQRILADLDAHLAKLPHDPRNGKLIPQLTSSNTWSEMLSRLEATATSVTNLDQATRDHLVSEVKKRLCTHFKVEGKAEKAMKACLAILRG